MIKQIALVTAKSGMNRDAFIKRYEQFHAPLALQILNFFCGYRRNYVVRDCPSSALPSTAQVLAPSFDGISEFWFSDQAALDEMASAIGETDAGRQISEDEEQIFDRSKIRMFGVDEYFVEGARSPSAEVTKPAHKIFIQSLRHGDLSREKFLELCETRHVPMVQKLLKDGGVHLSDYRRSYPSSDTNSMPHLDKSLPPLGFDLLSELSFDTQAHFDAFMAIVDNPQTAEVLANSETTIFDPSTVGWFKVEEHATSPDLLRGNS